MERILWLESLLAQAQARVTYGYRRKSLRELIAYLEDAEISSDEWETALLRFMNASGIDESDKELCYIVGFVFHYFALQLEAQEIEEEVGY